MLIASTSLVTTEVLPGEILQVLRATGRRSFYVWSLVLIRATDSDSTSFHFFPGEDLVGLLWMIIPIGAKNGPTIGSANHWPKRDGHLGCLFRQAKNHFPPDVAEGLAKDLRKLLDEKSTKSTLKRFVFS